MILLLILMLTGAGPVTAHGGEEHGAGPQWTFDPWIVVPIAALGILFALGLIRLSRRANARVFLFRSGLAYGAGWIALVAALVSPLHFIGEHLFTFHMIEHELVMGVAAPLLALARPVGILFWGMPRRLRHIARKAIKSRSAQRVWVVLSSGLVETALHGLAIWVWHVPALFDATVSDILLHRLQHLSFFATALLFWWTVLWKSDRGTAAWHLFVTMMHTTILGALIALAPRVAYMAQTQSAPEWGLTPLEDQQLAGIVMWVPSGIIYAGAALAMLALWIQGASRGGSHAGRIQLS